MRRPVLTQTSLALLLAFCASPLAAVQIADAALPLGVRGVAYPAFTLTATGGPAPYAFSVAAGTLPPGLTLSASGAITGAPTAAGGYAVTLRVTDGAAATATRAYTLTVNTLATPATWRRLGRAGWVAGAIVPSPDYANDRGLFAAGFAGNDLYRSTDGGQTWSRGYFTAPVRDGAVQVALPDSFSFSGTAPERKTLFVSSGGRLLRSQDRGSTFGAIDPAGAAGMATAVAAYANGAAGLITVIAAYWDEAAESGSVYRSDDAGANWTLCGGPFLSVRFTRILLSPAVAFDQVFYLVPAADYQSGGYLLRTQIGGFTFQSVFLLPPGEFIREARLSGDFPSDPSLYAVSSAGTLYKSPDGGASRATLSLARYGCVPESLEALQGSILVMCDPAHGAYPLLRSDDGGTTFLPLYSGGLRRNAGDDFSVVTAASPGGGPLHFFTALPSGVDRSTDGGFSFAAMDDPAQPLFELSGIAGDGAMATAGLSNPDATGLRYTGWYKSANGGRPWVRMPLPPATAGSDRQPLVPGVPNGYAAHRTLFLGGAGDIFRSTDGGASFGTVHSGTFGGVRGFAFSPAWNPATGRVYAATSAGVRVSADGGRTFSAPYMGGCAIQPNPPRVEQVVVASDGTLFAVTPDFLCESDDGGATFWARAPSLSDQFMRIAVSPTFTRSATSGNNALMIMTTSTGQIFRSVNGGANFSSVTWIPGQPNLPAFSPQFNLDGTILLATRNGVWRSSNGGLAFAPLGAPDALLERPVAAFHFLPGFDGRLTSASSVIAATAYAGFWISEDGGRSFSTQDQATVSHQLTGLAADGSPGAVPRLFAATGDDGVFRSDDGGLTFGQLSAGLPADSAMKAVAAPSALPTRPIAARAADGLWRFDSATGRWGKLAAAASGDFRQLYEAGTTLYAARADGPSLRSTNGGAGWTPLQASQTDLVHFDRNAQVTPTLGEPAAKRAGPGFATAATAPLWAVSEVAGPRYSADDGVTWTAAPGTNDYSLPGGQTWSVIRALGINPSSNGREVLAGTSTGLWLTRDGGDTWRRVDGPGSGLEATAKNYSALLSTPTAYGTDLLVGVAGATTGGVYLSGDGGEHWTQVNQGFDPAQLSISTLAKSSCAGCPVQYYSGSYGGGLYTRTITVVPPPALPALNYACWGSTGCACGTTAGSGPVSGGQSFKLCGSNFQNGLVVEFDGIPAAGCAQNGGTTITCSGTPAHVAGFATVRVRNPDTRVGYLPAQYQFTGGASRTANSLRVAKSGANANLTWSCTGCTAGNPGRLFRAQNAGFTVHQEQYSVGTASSFSNTGAVGTAQSYFWSVE